MTKTMKFLKLYLSMVVAVALGACMVSCSDDDDEEVVVEDSSANIAANIVGSYESTASVLFAYITSPMINTGDEVTITRVDNETVSVVYAGTTWGDGTFEAVAVTEADGVYTISGEGTLAVSAHGSTNDYAATIAGTITSSDDYEIVISVPSVMGGTVITLTATVLADYVLGDYEGANSVVFAYGTMDGDTATVTITKVSSDVVSVVYENDTWGTATFSATTVTEGDGVYVLTADEGTIAMGMPGSGTTSDYAATFSGTINSEDASDFEFVLSVPSVMGGTTITVSPFTEE